MHPGEILREEFMAPLGMTAGELAGALRLSAPSIEAVLSERADLTADLAMRLGRYFGTSADMWLRLQLRYDLDVAQDTAGDRIEREVQPRVNAG